MLDNMQQQIARIDSALSAFQDETRQQFAQSNTNLSDFKEETRQRFESIDANLSAFKGEMYAFRREAARASVRLEGQLQEMRGEISASSDRIINAVTTKIDDFAREVEASRRERTLQDTSFRFLKDGLEDHESRLTRLERRGKKQ